MKDISWISSLDSCIR